MILNPAIIAIITSSLLITAFAVYASAVGLQIIRRWDINSGSERQLELERKTYLISTVLAYLFVLGLFMLFLFIFTADHFHNLFVGAMCAAGSFNVNKYGYPVLLLKILTFILSGVWLILNHADSKGFDYPLIRFKYKLLILITALLMLDSFLLINYFFNLRANVITSCCGTLFGEGAQSIAGELASLPSIPAKIVFYLSFALAMRTGIHFMVTKRAAPIFSALSVWFSIFSIVSIISFISLYFYELPTHHCPFCLLQKDYYYVGYPLYGSLLAAGIGGISVGVLDRAKGAASLKSVIPVLQKRLCLFSMIGFVVFTLIATYPIIFSSFSLEGY